MEITYSVWGKRKFASPWKEEARYSKREYAIELKRQLILSGYSDVAIKMEQEG